MLWLGKNTGTEDARGNPCSTYGNTCARLSRPQRGLCVCVFFCAHAFSEVQRSMPASANVTWRFQIGNMWPTEDGEKMAKMAKVKNASSGHRQLVSESICSSSAVDEAVWSCGA